MSRETEGYVQDWKEGERTPGEVVLLRQPYARKVIAQMLEDYRDFLWDTELEEELRIAKRATKNRCLEILDQEHRERFEPMGGYTFAQRRVLLIKIARICMEVEPRP